MKERIIKIFCFPLFFILNRLIRKNKKAVMFIPHANSKSDNYDLLNGDSDNVLCLLNNLLRDHDFDSNSFYIGYYDKNKLEQYKEYCSNFGIERITFFEVDDYIEMSMSFCKCSLIFTDETFRRYRIKKTSQKIVCLNYYAGFMKNDYYQIIQYGGFKRMILKQLSLYRNYNNIISTSDMCSMFLTVEDCMYYGNILPLGFPRNDVFYQDNTHLRKKVEEAVGLDFKHIITYVPTHRDYENEERKDFFDPKTKISRSIFGPLSSSELDLLDKTLEETNSIIIVKIHPVQVRNNIVQNTSKRVIYYHELVNKVCVSLNPLLAITDCLITDYTTAVYDYLHRNKPIIYYFYDIEKYKGSRGLFIDPINPICMGEVTYNMQDLCAGLISFAQGDDNYESKRRIISDLLIKNKDGVSVERIKQNFFKREIV